MPSSSSPSTLPLRAIVLAAGRGERMRPLTDTTPKPLLPVHGRPLIEWTLRALARDGVEEVVINTAWLEDTFPAALGNGSALGLRLRYSHEGRDFGGALETAGGIATVLDWLSEAGRPAFWVVAGDLWMPDFQYDAAFAQRFVAHGGLDAHLWMVANPPFHPDGDFGLGAPLPELGAAVAAVRATQREAAHPSATSSATPSATYASVALMRPGLLDGVAPGQHAALRPALLRGIDAGRVSLSMLDGRWENVGTPAQWAALQTPPPA
jgi:N-acetyl-alpha-D-muramate 1-phosphate uridylyltransferase